MSCLLDFLDRHLLSVAPEMIDCRVTCSCTQPAGQGAASVVAGESAAVLEQSCDEFLSQVFALGEVPAGLFRTAPGDRQIGVDKILPGDAVSPGTGKCQEQVF